MAHGIHPTAVVDSSAELGENVQIGPLAIVEAETRIGDGSHIHAGAAVLRWTTLGDNNVVHSCAVLGGDPQDYGHDSSIRSYLRIGDGNVFREGCTINRGTGAEAATVIGDNNYLMACAHVGHNCQVGSHCILTNGSALGGYVELGDRAILSANVVIHQFCWVGEMVMSRGNAASAMHVPPYCMLGGVTELNGLNRVGLRRAPQINDEDRKQITEAYRLLYRSGLTAGAALDQMDACTDWGEPAGKFRSFVRRALEAEPPYKRGLCKDVTKRAR